MDPVKALVEARPTMFDFHAADLSAAIEIAPGIWMSTGTSNAYMVVTGAGRVIINTGMSYEGALHKRLFDAVDRSPIPYIVLTQGHIDHSGGVHLFREPGTVVIAQKNQAICRCDVERIKAAAASQAGTWFRASFESMAKLAAAHPEAATDTLPIPDLLFEDRHDFSVGGVEFKLLSTPGGETIDSAAVWLPQRRILFTGNLFGPLFPHFPNINTLRGDKYRFIEPYLDSLRRVRALEPELLVTGHFDPITGRDLIRACLDRLEAAVSFVHEQTLAGINAGRSIWSLMREVVLPPELYVGQGYGKVSWAVRTIWEQYMGWFKSEATSELYPTRPSAIFPDLVDLAGNAAVVARGRQKLAEGDPEEALLLAEAALAHDAQDRLALTLALDVHRALLSRCGGTNFWEVGWLRSRIETLEAAVGSTKTNADPQ